MNPRSACLPALALLIPLLLILSLILPIGCGSGNPSVTFATPQPTAGNAEVGFVDAPAAGFQNVLLNVVHIKMNPHSNAPGSAPGWVTVPVPAGTGLTGAPIFNTNVTGGGPFFNTTLIAGPGPSELQIDLNQLQDNVQIFNIWGVPAQTYRSIFVQLDNITPAVLTPNCGAPGSPLEGCKSYRAVLAKGAVNGFSTQTVFPVGKGGVSPLIIEFNLGTPTPPADSTGTYTISPTISVLPNIGSVGAKMGLISGNVTGTLGQYERVTAELAGTRNVVASALVVNDFYTMNLPAAPQGTAYDFYAFGNESTFAEAQNVVLQRGQIVGRNFAVTGTPSASVGGFITDGCTGAPLGSASIALLASPTGADCVSNPATCVVVATDTTDGTGQWPLPGRTGIPQPFRTIPDGSYALRISQSGYDPILTPLVVTNGAATCPASVSRSDCSFALTTNYIRGTVSVNPPPPPGTSTEVQVYAENAGTNQIVSALPNPVSIPPCGAGPCAVSFTLNAPLSPGTYDLFATTLDFYSGLPDPYTGHTIATIQNAASNESCTQPTTPTIALGPLECTGHGSLTGTVASGFDSGTQIELSKGNVQIMQSLVGPASSVNAGIFSFCAPADTYSVQKFEDGTPAGSPAGITLPPPAPITASPCPLCALSSGQCPGICAGTALGAPL
ncbi:MAG: carboxypeptidase-like regulatory domain-containing protein [Candidatus Binataceae bacterium]